MTLKINSKNIIDIPKKIMVFMNKKKNANLNDKNTLLEIYIQYIYTFIYNDNNILRRIIRLLKRIINKFF